ncbi:MAG: hypothetical protein ACK4GQ_04790, partial [Candidatus Hadarchaeales archaeon]
YSGGLENFGKVYLWLYDENGGFLHEATYVTSSVYQWENFEPPGATLIGPHTVDSPDLDNDNYIDALVVKARISVQVPGVYS